MGEVRRGFVAQRNIRRDEYEARLLILGSLATVLCYELLQVKEFKLVIEEKSGLPRRQGWLTKATQALLSGLAESMGGVRDTKTRS